ncbi:MAG: cytochrome c [Candidatus Obscuribacterales bacterium]|nr:cytochrome c [Candidatus Obscuribacterales bacterium]
MKIRNIILSTFVMVSIAVPLYAQSTNKSNSPNANAKAQAAKPSSSIERGRKVFGSHCASCHADLGNSVKPNKPIKGSQVLSTVATFKSYLNEPLGDMPHYEHVITDEKVLNALYAYVKDAEKQPSNKEKDNEVLKGKGQKS